MSLKPIAQLGAEVSTLLAIKFIGAKDAASITAKAKAALVVAGILQAASTGSITSVGGQISALILAPGQDPGVSQVVNDLWDYAGPFLSVEAEVAGTTLGGKTVEAVIGEIATGMIAIAAVYVPKP